MTVTGLHDDRVVTPDEWRAWKAERRVLKLGEWFYIFLTTTTYRVRIVNVPEGLR